MSKSGTTIRYEYNHDGLRTQKFVDTSNKADATYYTYNGKNIIHVIKNSDHLHIFYDAQNRPAKVSHNGIFYTYLYNLQGDVVGLLDKNGALVVEYKYDAWGKPLSITGALANTLGQFNPFRYRGYVYDDETGLYYLGNRYYVSKMGRFLSTDSVIVISSGVMYNNMFAYCKNGPVIRVDRDGRWFEGVMNWLIDTFAPAQLNVKERELVTKHPFAALDAEWARKTACTVTKGLFGENWNSDDTQENAFKHCLWNALMAYKMGEDLARQFGEAHEYGMMEGYPESTKMDLHNNEVGYSLVATPPTSNELTKRH